MHNLITTFSDFVLNETLVTHDIDLTIKNVESELSLQNVNIHIIKNDNNSFDLHLKGVQNSHNIKLQLDYLSSLITDRHGWFPSKMKLISLTGLHNSLMYDSEIIITKCEFLKKVVITYEAKYDLEINIPDVLYHLSINQFKNSVISNGLVPKSKSKLSKHMDRIYVCGAIDACYNLINNMKMNYSGIKFKNSNNIIDDSWILYKIDTKGLDLKLYKDPNYNEGYYIIDNIPPSNIKIIDTE